MFQPTDIIASIEKGAVAALPPVVYEGEITVVDGADAVDAAVADLRRCDVIGFDTETRPSFTKGRPNNVALMQLSTPERCYLFRLNMIGMPLALKALLEDSEIKKIGLSVHDDFRVMHRNSVFDPQAFVDLQALVKDYNIADISLQKIYAILFGHKISKGQRLTNWEAPTLTRQQQTYAAIDAWACLKIYRHLTEGRFDIVDSPYAITYQQLLDRQHPATDEKD